MRLALVVKDLLGSANNDWALSFLGENGLTSQHLDLDIQTFMLHLIHFTVDY